MNAEPFPKMVTWDQLKVLSCQERDIFLPVLLAAVEAHFGPKGPSSLSQVLGVLQVLGAVTGSYLILLKENEPELANNIFNRIVDSIREDGFVLEDNEKP